jgi:uncharacterized RDD family membrane protein YckC
MANLNVKTSFNTKLQFNTDSIGKRLLAYFLDLLVMVAYLVLLSWVLSFFNFELGDAFEEDASRIYWGWTSLFSLPILFYTLISEVASGGYTLGKYIVGIKVVKIEGFQPTFVDFFIRWIFRVVDIYFIIILAVLINSDAFIFLAFYFTGIVGIISITRSKTGQRLGDLVAGTTVIRSKMRQNIKITILENISEGYRPTYSQVVKLSDNDARIIKETYENAVKLNDTKLLIKLVSKIENVINVKNDTTPRRFIDVVLKDFNYYTQNM